nr:hypothetical protein [uncultured Roseococcus sp.]
MPSASEQFDQIVADYQTAQSEARTFSQQQTVKADFIVNALRHRIGLTCDMANEKLRHIGYALNVQSSFGREAGYGASCRVNLVRGTHFDGKTVDTLTIALGRDGSITAKPDRSISEPRQITPELTEEETAHLVAAFVRAALPIPFRPA